jgi:hypothetical protein
MIDASALTLAPISFSDTLALAGLVCVRCTKRVKEVTES